MDYKQILKEMSYNNILDELWNEYQNKVFEYADKVFRDTILPFCKKRRYQFISGNGDWRFVINNKLIQSVDIELDMSSDFELMEIRALLDSKIEGMPSDSLGSLMQNYDPKYQPILDRFKQD